MHVNLFFRRSSHWRSGKYRKKLCGSSVKWFPLRYKCVNPTATDGLLRDDESSLESEKVFIDVVVDSLSYRDNVKSYILNEMLAVKPYTLRFRYSACPKYTIKSTIIFSMFKCGAWTNYFCHYVVLYIMRWIIQTKYFRTCK